MLYLMTDEFKVEYASKDFVVGEISVDDTKQLSYLRKGELVGWFNGVDTYLSFLKNKFKTAKREKSSENVGGNSFNSFKSYDEAMDTYINHPDKVLAFEEIDEPIREWEETGTSVEYGITGDFVDIGRYMHGVPEVFGSMKDGNPRRYRANIVINLSWVYSVNQETINERLKHTVALVDWLELNGVRTSITGVSSHSCSHVEIQVKDFDGVLDLRQLAVVSHSDFLRRAIFRFDEYSKTWDYGYGNAVIYSNEMSRRGREQNSFVELDLMVDSRNSDENEYADRFKDLREEITTMLDTQELKPIVVLN